MPNNTYLVTGGNRGLGLEFVRQISKSSDNTIFACVRSLQGELDDLQKLSSTNSSIHIVECNTASVDSIKAGVAKISEILGQKQLDYLINNAGINAVPDRTALDFTGDELREHIDINVVGPAEMVKALESKLGKGSVVLNMSSGLGSCGKGIVKCTAYAVSKAALNMLTLHQVDALKEKGVSVIVMDPGWVQTRMGGIGAVLTPEESIGGMLKVLHNTTFETSGSFYQYDGDTVPW